MNAIATKPEIDHKGYEEHENLDRNVLMVVLFVMSKAKKLSPWKVRFSARPLKAF